MAYADLVTVDAARFFHQSRYTIPLATSQTYHLPPTSLCKHHTTRSTHAVHTPHYLIPPEHKVAHHTDSLKQCKRTAMVTYRTADSAEMLSGILPVSWLL
jgi:hypothetical protein